jgi:hypothetical protein
MAGLKDHELLQAIQTAALLVYDSDVATSCHWFLPLMVAAEMARSNKRPPQWVFENLGIWAPWPGRRLDYDLAKHTFLSHPAKAWLFRAKQRKYPNAIESNRPRDYTSL